MFEIWKKNLRQNLEAVQEDAGPSVVTIVSGSEVDRTYWKERFQQIRYDVFRKSGDSTIISVLEEIKMGNFLGTFNAWAETQHAMAKAEIALPDITLMSMVFGQGRRLSPFTQTLGNRKSAFWTPRKAQSAETYLSTADISNLCANNWVSHLIEGGFRGVIVKWGDELIIPSMIWGKRDYTNIDAFRCVGQVEITEDLAREKDWVVVDAQRGLMRFQYTRQNLDSLQKRLLELGSGQYGLRINLGSLVISYEFINTALEIFRGDIFSENTWADWDPYIWMALFCDESQWRLEAEYERRNGQTGIQKLESHYPDFFAKVQKWRNALESKTGRPLTVGILDFGDPFWIDLGLQLTLRQNMDLINTDSDRGRIMRDFFEIPHDRDNRGNIVVRSTVPDSADIQNSIIVDSIISDETSVMRGGLVIGGRHRKILMPYGGSALFCAADLLNFTGPHTIAFRSVSREIVLPEGERHTTILLPEGPEDMITNESIVDYRGDNYSLPILGNRLSFEKVGKKMSKIDGNELDSHWFGLWSKWLR